MDKKRKPWTARRIHLWVAVSVAIPMVLIAVSGALIALRSVTTVQVPARWLGAESVPERLPIMAYLETTDGNTWIGNAKGLSVVSPTGARTVEAFSGQEIVGLAAVAGKATPMVATKMAIWTEVDGAWQAVRRGRVRQLSSLSDGRVLAIAGGRGEMADSRPMVTSDGENWQPYKPAMMANKQLPALENPTVALHQFMRELHSGAYFFGKGPGEIIWSNVMGWVLVLLSLTGLWMWFKRERQKMAAKAIASKTPQAAFVHLEGQDALAVEPGVLLNTLWEHLPNAECQSGECGGCKLRLLEGTVTWIREPVAELNRKTHILACSCEAVGSIRCAAV